MSPPLPPHVVAAFRLCLGVARADDSGGAHPTRCASTGPCDHCVTPDSEPVVQEPLGEDGGHRGPWRGIGMKRKHNLLNCRAKKKSPPSVKMEWDFVLTPYEGDFYG